MAYEHMADAAFPQNIPPGFPIVAGYYGGAAYHVWSQESWKAFPGYRLPIWVAAEGAKNGTNDGQAAVATLHALGVPEGCLTVLDMEADKDITYVEAFDDQLHGAGYKVLVYGSAGVVFGNPPLNGYWVADYTTDHEAIRQLMQAPSVRAVQYAANLAPGYDASYIKQWEEGQMWHG